MYQDVSPTPSNEALFPPALPRALDIEASPRAAATSKARVPPEERRGAAPRGRPFDFLRSGSAYQPPAAGVAPAAVAACVPSQFATVAVLPYLVPDVASSLMK